MSTAATRTSGAWARRADVNQSGVSSSTSTGIVLTRTRLAV
jgi:hypothetical protein